MVNSRLFRPAPSQHCPNKNHPRRRCGSFPKGAYAAMRNNIVELMTDPLTPLFKTFGLNAVNTSMNRLMAGFLGTSGVLPGNPIIAVNEYAYYNGSVKFGPMLKIVLDSRGILKRMFTGAVERWTEAGRPRYLETVEMWEGREWRSLPTTELLIAANELAEAAIDAYGALVSGVIPAAWMSEAWFTLWLKFNKRKGDPPAPTYLMGFENLPISAEKSLYDLAMWAQTQPRLSAALSEMDTQEIIAHLENDQVPSGIDPDEWEAWQVRFREYLDRYGHTIYNLDFGNPVPADDPAPLLETFKLFLCGDGVNPHERQAASAERREAATRDYASAAQGAPVEILPEELGESAEICTAARRWSGGCWVELSAAA